MNQTKLSWVIAASMAACSVGCKGDPPTHADGSAQTEGRTQPPEQPEPQVGKACLESDTCPGQVCDKRHGGCVDCYVHEQCPDGQICSLGSCVEPGLCASNLACDVGACAEDGTRCVDCQADADCPYGLACVDTVCRPAFQACAGHSECSAQGAVCLSTGKCGACTDASQCGIHELCTDNECVPRPCTPSQAFCEGDTVMVCRDDGQGAFMKPCGDGQTCFAGECILDECEPGTSYCLKYQLMECTSGGKLLAKGCPPGLECIGDSCQPTRHRVHVIFDTSGSMGWFPGTTTWPTPCGAGSTEGCLEPWPACEDQSAPITKMGIAKNVFKQFFQGEAASEVLFGLQRFPQVADQASPACEGGYYTPVNLMTGEDEKHVLPLGEHTWFDAHLGEVVVVPFPPGGEGSNMTSLLEWIDYQEWVVPTGEPCVTPEDCVQGVCLKGECSTFANPELRPKGWTPLGKSLYYAGEYIRRYVVIDGKPCQTDTDCPSPGYYCSEAKECFDPQRDCRLTVVVLFTDGDETQYPLHSSFFNPKVQAKRLRHGLGCKTDADCSDRKYCLESTDPLLDGCHATTCSTQGYCTNQPIEVDPLDPITTSFGPSEDRLYDYNGNPIEVIVSVVDASGDEPGMRTSANSNNRVIALYGGGIHVTVTTENSLEFLSQLNKTVDFKQMLYACSEDGIGGK